MGVKMEDMSEVFHTTLFYGRLCTHWCIYSIMCMYRRVCYVWQKKKRFLIFMLASQVSCWWQRITEYMSENKRILHKYKHIPSVWQLWLFIITSIWLEHCHCQALCVCVLCGIGCIVWNSIFYDQKRNTFKFI